MCRIAEVMFMSYVVILVFVFFMNNILKNTRNFCGSEPSKRKRIRGKKTIEEVADKTQKPELSRA